MGLFPKSLNGKIQFFEAHNPTWQSNASAIGSSSAEITALEAKTSAARAALIAQKEAHDLAQTKTAALRDAVDAMMEAGSKVIKKIRSKAADDGNVIYQLANIPAPGTPSPVGELTKAGQFKVELDETGAIKLSWKCAQPRSASAVTYQIWRQIGTSGPWHSLGGTGAKYFVDETIPAGSAQVIYKIQATRSTSKSPWAMFMVNFGSGPAGTMNVTVTELNAPKIAA